MSEYIAVLKEYGYKHRKFIQIYLMIAMAVSVAFAFSGNYLIAAEAAGVATTVGVLGGSFGAVFGAIAESNLTGLDVSSVMALSSIVSIIVQYVPQGFFDTIHMSFAKQYSFGLLEFWPVRIFCFVWCAVSWISRSTQVSDSFGVILENIESYLGFFVNIAVLISQIFMNGTGLPVEAASLVDNGVTAAVAHHAVTMASFTNVLLTGANILIGFFILVYCALAYIFVRLLFLYIDVILVPICSMIPCSSAVVNIIKFTNIFWMGVLAIFAPYVFMVLYGIILILAIIFFPRAVRAIRYYGNIYTKPFFKRMRGFRQDYPLVFPKIPKPIRLKENLEGVTLVMPVYLLRKLTKKYKKYQLWYLIQTPTEAYLCKPKLSKKKPNLRIDLENSVEKKMFIRKGARYFEVFNLRVGEEEMTKSVRRIHKDIHFVFSKEYYYRYDEIKNYTGYVDFKEYQTQILNEKKAAKKALREMKRMEREEAREAKRIARMEKRMAKKAAKEKEED